MLRMYRLLLALLLMGMGGGGDVYQRITIDEGLSQNMVNDLLLDHQGFLWFATKDGLNRYDGYTFTVYRNYPGQQESLTSNHITSLWQTSDRAIWMTTFGGGVNRLDPVTRVVEPVRGSGEVHLTYGNVLRGDRRDRVWALSQTDGLVRIDARTRAFTALRSLRGMAGGADVSTFAISEADNLWTISAQAIQHVSPDRGQLLRWDVPDLALRPTSLLALNDSLLLFATRTGLHYLHREGTTLRHRPTAVQGQAFGFGSGLHRDAQGRIWFVSLTDLYRYDPTADRLHHLFRHDTQPTGAMLTDHSGILWMGTAGWGAMRYNPARQYLRKGTGPFPPVVFPELIQALQRAGVEEVGWTSGSDYAIARATSGDVWLTTVGHAVFRYRPSDQSLRRYRASPMLRRHSLFRGFNRVHVAADGTVWLAGSGGVFALDPNSGTFTYHALYEGAVADQEYLNRTGYPDITVLASDPAGALWMGTPDRGLVRYDPRTRQARWYRHDPAVSTSISSNQILSIAPDPADPARSLWVGTEGGGLNRLDLTSGTFERLYTDSGLPSMVVYALLPDEMGHVWLSTNNGLARLHPQSREIRTFTPADGLHSREFNRFEYYRAEDGSLFFGGIGGFTQVIPSAFTPNTHEPRLRLTNVLLFNQGVSAAVVNALNEPRLSPLRFRYDQNVISFTFAALEFTASGSNRYRYRMDGFDRDWIPARTSRTATYTNLAPGTYTFRVMAANSDGVWSEQELRVPLYIAPPYWMTWWFRVLALVLVSGVIGLLVHQQMQKLRREKQYQEEVTLRVIERQEEERRRMAHEMHDGLGQELLILKNMLYRWAKRPETADPAVVMQSASDQISGILKNVREITHNLRPPELDRIGVTETVRYTLEKATDSAGLRLRADIEPFNGAIPKEYEINLVRIVQELLSNTVRHAEATEVTCTVSREAGRLHLHYHDDGRGMEAPADGSALRSGLGLSGIAERVRILGGTMEVHPAGGPGVRIDLYIPAREGEG